MTQEAPPPLLRFVPVDKILAHEEADHQRYQSLMKRIDQSGIWLHPPIVSPLPDSDGLYVILDGANRCHCAKALGFPHVLVQVAPYDSGQVELDTWSHVVSNLPLVDFMHEVEGITGVEVRKMSLLTAQAELAQRISIAYMLNLRTQEVYALYVNDHTLGGRNSALRALVGAYKHSGKLDRVNHASESLVMKLFPNAEVLVVFPHYEPAEIMVAARDNQPLPAGISRHIIQGRAMRLNYPLDALRNQEQSIEEKNAAIDQWMIRIVEKRAMRFYAESTYMFDE